jgi:uncharacterized protein
MIYLDTSVIVSSLATETATARAQAWLKDNSSKGLAISPWVTAEFHSALAMKLRLKIVSADERARILHEFNHLKRQGLHIFDVDADHFRAAADYSSHENLALRAADALHLAIASDNGAALCTLDQTLFDAAKALGIDAVIP